MKPNKLKRHLEHSEMQSEAEDYLHRKLDENSVRRKSFVNTITASSRALLASFEVSCRIAQNKERHTIAETVVLPAETDMAQTMIGEAVLSNLVTYRCHTTVTGVQRAD
jgi:hypothetical protein